MTLQEFIRRARIATDEEREELYKQYPAYLEQYAGIIEKEIADHEAGRAVVYDDMDYQRSVDRGVEDIERYNYFDDI